MYRSEQCALKRQEELRTVGNGVHVLPNGEVDGSDDHVSRAAPEAPGADVSRPAPTIVRSHAGLVPRGGRNVRTISYIPGSNLAIAKARSR